MFEMKEQEHLNNPKIYSSKYFIKNKKSVEIWNWMLMFCYTLRVSMRTIALWLKNKWSSPAKNKDEAMNTSEQKRKVHFEKETTILKTFFDNLPKLESHYCRKLLSKKLYLLSSWTED